VAEVMHGSGSARAQRELKRCGERCGVERGARGVLLQGRVMGAKAVRAG
jgi:hypothetical protein